MQEVIEIERCRAAKANGFTYNPETGELRGVRGRVITGKRLGYIDCQVFCENKYYKIFGHRLAWYLHYGRLPADILDHIDGDKANNRISNLREVNNQQNQWNQTKAKGYTWRNKRKRFEATIRINDRLIYLGYFKEESEARNAYLEAKKKYHVIPQ